jgi:bacteriocin biosynthesis cyclodehydratase domain-containing protein
VDNDFLIHRVRREPCHMDEDLPQRPRVRPGLPVLRRRAGELQVGLDPRHATVVSGLPESVVGAIAGRLTGHRTTADLLHEIGPDPAGRSALRDLLTGLAARGLLEDLPAAPKPGRLAGEEVSAVRPQARGELRVAVHGDGRLAVSVACLLAAAGVGWVNVTAGGRVRPQDTGTGYLADDVGKERAAAAHAAVARVDGSVRTDRLTLRQRPDLVLLTDAVVPDPELVARLTGQRVPHLSTHLRDGIGVVGPLVIPGLTSCLRCADLLRAQADGCWPGIATQLAGRPQLADLACTQATAAFAVAQALAVLTALRWSPNAHKRPATWNASVEIDPGSAATHHRDWPPHPSCPCRDLRRRTDCPEVAAHSTTIGRQSAGD